MRFSEVSTTGQRLRFIKSCLIGKIYLFFFKHDNLGILIHNFHAILSIIRLLRRNICCLIFRWKYYRQFLRHWRKLTALVNRTKFFHLEHFNSGEIGSSCWTRRYWWFLRELIIVIRVNNVGNTGDVWLLDIKRVIYLSCCAAIHLVEVGRYLFFRILLGIIMIGVVEYVSLLQRISIKEHGISCRGTRTRGKQMWLIALLGTPLLYAISSSILCLRLSLQLLWLEQNCRIINLGGLFQELLIWLRVLLVRLNYLGIIHIFLVVRHRWLCKWLQFALRHHGRLVLVVGFLWIRTVVQVDASRILLTLDLCLPSSIVDKLIHGRFWRDILGRKGSDLPRAFGGVNDVLVDRCISNDAVIQVGDEQILVALVFTLLKVEVWLIGRFFTVVTSGKSGRINFTDVVQIYGMIVLMTLIIAPGWLHDAWLHSLYLLRIFVLVLNVWGEELLPLLSIRLLSIIDANHFTVVCIHLAARMFARDRKVFRSRLKG